MKEASWKQHGQMGRPRAPGPIHWDSSLGPGEYWLGDLEEWFTFFGLQCSHLKNGIHLCAWMVVRTILYEIGKFLGKNEMFIQQLIPQCLHSPDSLSSIKIQTWIRHHPHPWGTNGPVGKTDSIITLSCAAAPLMGRVGEGGGEMDAMRAEGNTYSHICRE